VRPPARWGRAREDVWTAVAVAVVLVVFLLDLAVVGEGFEGILLVGPVVASATASSRRTAQVVALALVAGILTGAVHDRLTTASQVLRLAGVLVGGGFCVLAAHWRERRERDLQRVTRVAEVAQLAILRPIPSRVGPVAFASRYLSAAEQAFIGGDLYEVVPSAAGVRVVVGDVRGKGLEAVHLAALVLGSFREAATVEAALDDVAAAVDRAVSTDIALEDFVTAVFVEFRPGGEITVVNCGHHPPLRVSGFGAQYLAAEQTTTPLGLTPSFTVQSHRLRATACSSTPTAWSRPDRPTAPSSSWRPTTWTPSSAAASTPPWRDWWRRCCATPADISTTTSPCSSPKFGRDGRPGDIRGLPRHTRDGSRPG
jgi:sigma-B regulation protein RsbU (phosphoserine phosphatase)